MRRIATNEEMAKLQLAGVGYIFNERSTAGERKVHAASCESLAAMVATAHPKYHSTDREEARAWLDEKFGVFGWSNCGRCGGILN